MLLKMLGPWGFGFWCLCQSGLSMLPRKSEKIGNQTENYNINKRVRESRETGCFRRCTVSDKCSKCATQV